MTRMRANFRGTGRLQNNFDRTIKIVESIQTVAFIMLNRELALCLVPLTIGCTLLTLVEIPTCWAAVRIV